MRKIKFLILALLGITIIPTATNAYDIVNKFNGNYGLLYKEFKGSVLYRCPYTSNMDLSANPSWQATSSSFPCIPGQKFFNGYDRGQFGEGRFVDINQDVVQYITAIKKKDWNYLPIWVNLQRKFWKFQVEHKNWTVYYDEVKTSSPYQYEVNLKSYDGRYGQLLWWLFLDGLLIKSYSKENGNAYDPGYKTVVVVDTDTRMWYKFDINISLKEALDTSFISLFYSLYNSSPRGCYQMGINYWQYFLNSHSFSFKNDCPEFDIKQKLEKSLTISQWIRKLFKEESPYYDPNYKVDKILWEVPETTAPSANSAEAYNQCLAYYNSVKTYASYDRNCYKDLLDSNQDIGLRQQITDWDWEWEWPATDNRICNLRKWYKKSYKTKFKDKWSEFLELSSANRLSPHSLNVKDYCWEKPRDDKNSFYDKTYSFFEKANDWFDNSFLNVRKRPVFGKFLDKITDPFVDFWRRKFQWDEIAVLNDDWSVLATVSDLYNERAELLDLKQKSENEEKYTINERKEFLKQYEEKKQAIINKYKKYSDDNLAVSQILWDLKNWQIKEDSSDVVDWLKEAFLSDYNQGKWVFGNNITCNNPIFDRNWDFLVYIPFFFFVFLFFKYLF